MLKLCLNWKVLAGLGAVAVGVLVFAPQLALSALPLLLLAACPLSMLVMMAGMGRMTGTTSSRCEAAPGQASRPVTARTREEQLADLKQQLADLRMRQDAVARSIAQLEAPEAGAVRQTDATAPLSSRG